MSLLSVEAINRLLREEAEIDLHGQYSENIVPTIASHWDEIAHEYIILDHLLYCMIRFRMSCNRPPAALNSLNYYPTIFKQHSYMLRYIASVIYHFLQSTSMYINFSPCLVLLSEVPGNTIYNFLYSSHNYCCLQSAYFIHNDENLYNFLVLLQNFNFEQYLESAHQSISGKYENQYSLIPISLTFHILKAPNIVFGFDHRYLSPKKPGNCVFNSMSCFFNVCKSGTVSKKQLATQRIHKKRGAAIKGLFIKWLKRQKLSEKELNRGKSLCTY